MSDRKCHSITFRIPAQDPLHVDEQRFAYGASDARRPRTENCVASLCNRPDMTRIKIWSHHHARTVKKDRIS